MNFISKQFDFKKSDKTILIGEIGVNHNGDKKLLFDLIDQGILSGIDILKFQRFNSEEEISIFAESAEYQKNANQGDSQLELAKKLELPDEWLLEVFDYCKKKKVGFLCTAFDFSSVDFIADELKCSSIKVPSPEITNIPLLEYIADRFEGVILSTGASNLSETIRASKIFDRNELVVMHCLSEYPAPIDEINLNCMETLEHRLDCPIGYSDHTEGVIAPIIASSMGAVVIEKHYTLDKTMEGPDHSASASIEEINEIVFNLKTIHASKGSYEKEVAPSEKKNQSLIRKSITCAHNFLEPGTKISEDMLSYKRPVAEGSIEPFDFKKILGKTLRKEKRFDEPFFWSDFYS